MAARHCYLIWIVTRVDVRLIIRWFVLICVQVSCGNRFTGHDRDLLKAGIVKLKVNSHYCPLLCAEKEFPTHLLCRHSSLNHVWQWVPPPVSHLTFSSCYCCRLWTICGFLNWTGWRQIQVPLWTAATENWHGDTLERPSSLIRFFYKFYFRNGRERNGDWLNNLRRNNLEMHRLAKLAVQVGVITYTCIIVDGSNKTILYLDSNRGTWNTWMMVMELTGC